MHSGLTGADMNVQKIKMCGKWKRCRVGGFEHKFV